MSWVRNRNVRYLAAALLCLPLGGCSIVLDIFDPGLFPTQGGQGVVIVAFNNMTRFSAQFLAFESKDSQDLTRGARNFTADVQAGEVSNEVLDCPVELLSPGSLDAGFTRATVSAVVMTDSGQQEVSYTGPVLITPDFRCGDLIEFRLISTGGGGDAAEEFRISVQVIPG